MKSSPPVLIQRRSENYFPALLAWGITLTGLVLLAPRLIDFARIASDFIAWPWQFDFAEGVNLNASLELAAGHNIYRLSNPATFISAPYTPLFFVLTAPFTWLTGPSFAAGRIISVLATLAIAVLLAIAVGKVTSRRSMGVLSGTLWLSISPVIVWSALYTPHIVALAFGFGGLVWIMLNREARGLRFLIGPLLFALAFFTKQSAVDATGAAVLWLLLSDPRRGVRFALTLAVMVLVPFLAANLLLRGGLWEHAITNQGLASNDRRFNRLLARLWNEHWPLLTLGIAFSASMLAALAATWRKRTWLLGSPFALAVLYFLIACASVAIRLGREGVNYNHFIDCLLPACLLFGLALGRSLGTMDVRRGRDLLLPIAGVVLAAGLLLAQIFSFTDPRTWYSGPWPDLTLDVKMQMWSQMVADAMGEVYSEDAYLALTNGKRLAYDDDFMFMALARDGKWDQSTFVQSLWDRRFSLVILQTGSTRFSPQASEALDASYTLKVQDRLNIYAPKPVPLAPQFKLNCTLQGNGDSVRLLGYSLPPGVAWNGASRGETLHVTLYWQTQRTATHDYASHVQLVNESGERVAAQDNPHTAAGRPTTEWQPGETVLDSAGLPIPDSVPVGRYTLLGGMYLFQGGALSDLTPACEGQALSAGPITLGSIEIK